MTNIKILSNVIKNELKVLAKKVCTKPKDSLNGTDGIKTKLKKYKKRKKLKDANDKILYLRYNRTRLYLFFT